jgi:hypothetical protein
MLIGFSSGSDEEALAFLKYAAWLQPQEMVSQ